MDRGYFIPQTGHAEFSEDAVTIKAEYRFLLFPPYWDLSVGSFFTASPLSTNQSGVDARFLGVNLRLGYRLPFIHEPWEFHIFGGAYYTTMFVTNNAFGYRNELGPQLFPTLRRFFKNGDGISVYFKYSPVTSGFSALTSSNREIAVGGSWLLRLRNQHLVSFSLDYSNVSLDFPTLSSSLQVNVINFGVGYNL
jgi:hypothetical protein